VKGKKNRLNQRRRKSKLFIGCDDSPNNIFVLQAQKAFSKISDTTYIDNFDCISLSNKIPDVTLVVGSKEYRCCRSVLVQASPVFSSLFSGEWVEKDKIVLSEERSTVMYFKDFMQFINGDTLELNTQNIFPLLVLCNKYHADTYFLKIARQFLSGITNAKNVAALANFAETFYLGALKEDSYLFTCHNMDSVLAHLGEFLVEVLEEILGRDDIYVSDEHHLFTAIYKLPESKKRSLLPFIRYSQMSPLTLHTILSLLSRQTENEALLHECIYPAFGYISVHPSAHNSFIGFEHAFPGEKFRARVYKEYDRLVWRFSIPHDKNTTNDNYQLKLSITKETQQIQAKLICRGIENLSQVHFVLYNQFTNQMLSITSTFDEDKCVFKVDLMHFKQLIDEQWVVREQGLMEVVLYR